jgi:AraC-like DNA-binding protein
MPQTVDPLTGRLSDPYQFALREFFAHYRIEIVSCAFWRNRAPWDLPTRKCMDSFLLFPLRGEVRAKLPEGSRLFGPGTYLALPDGVQHALRLEKGHERLEQISLHCRIHDRWQRPFLVRFSSPVGKLRDAARWYRLLADLCCLMTRDPELGRRRGEVLVSELMAERLQTEKTSAPMRREGDPRIERVLLRMKEELAAPELSIDTLATGIGLTATQMRKLFFRETHTRPKHYLHKLRLERAVDLLRHSTLTVKQVALESGFATDNYFHHVFVKVFGVTPAAFREKNMI